MKIGELSDRTGVATRLLRYYEEQGLLAPSRAGNTYREYGEADVELARRVALMVRSGVPTRLIKVLLDLEETERRDVDEACPIEVAELLATELAELDARIACLTRSRTTIQEYLVRTEHSALLCSTRLAKAANDPADAQPGIT